MKHLSKRELKELDALCPNAPEALGGSFQSLVTAGVASFAYSYLGSGSPSNGGSGAVCTLAGASLGTAATDRYILVAVMMGDNTTAVTGITSVTVGGVSAALHQKTGFSAAAPSMGMCFAIAAVPTGTTGDIVVTGTGPANIDYCDVQWWRLTGLLSATPVATGSDTVASANALAATIATSDGGGIFAATTQVTAARTVTWTNATERDDAAASNGGTKSAADAATTGSSPTITAQYSGTTNTPIMIVGSWR